MPLFCRLYNEECRLYNEEIWNRHERPVVPLVPVSLNGDGSALLELKDRRAAGLIVRLLVEKAEPGEVSIA